MFVWPSDFAAVIKGLTDATTVADIQKMVIAHRTLLPSVTTADPSQVQLLFSPVFITPDVLLGRKTRQLLKPTLTMAAAQLIDDDILYVSD